MSNLTLLYILCVTSTYFALGLSLLCLPLLYLCLTLPFNMLYFALLFITLHRLIFPELILLYFFLHLFSVALAHLRFPYTTAFSPVLVSVFIPLSVCAFALARVACVGPMLLISCVVDSSIVLVNFLMYSSIINRLLNGLLLLSKWSIVENFFAPSDLSLCLSNRMILLFRPHH